MCVTKEKLFALQTLNISPNKTNALLSCSVYPVNSKHLYNMYTMSAQHCIYAMNMYGVYSVDSLM